MGFFKNKFALGFFALAFAIIFLAGCTQSPGTNGNNTGTNGGNANASGLNNSGGNASAGNGSNATQNGTISTVITGATPIPLAQVQAHNSASDCWAIANGDIINISGYVAVHPGDSFLLEKCGTDLDNATLGNDSLMLALYDYYVAPVLYSE